MKNRVQILKRAVVSHSTGFLVLDADGVVIAISDTAARYLGVDRLSALGREASGMILTEQQPGMDSTLIHALKTGECWSDDLAVYSDEEMRRLRLTAIPVTDQHQNVAGVLGMIYPADEASAGPSSGGESASKAARVRDSFAMGIGGEPAPQTLHELKNRLTTLRGLAQISQMIETESGRNDCVAQIIKEIDRLAELVNELAILNRPGRMEMLPESLPDIVAGVIGSVQAKAFLQNVRILTRFDPQLPEVVLNAKLIRQAILNVVINALQALPEGGTISIEGHVEKDGWVEILVADTGKGIPAEVQKQLFTPFFTTKGESGTGLGLVVTKQIVVEGHGGRIWLDSQEGNGTRVHIQLPVEGNPGNPGIEAVFRGLSETKAELVERVAKQQAEAALRSVGVSVELEHGSTLPVDTVNEPAPSFKPVPPRKPAKKPSSRKRGKKR